MIDSAFEGIQQTLYARGKFQIALTIIDSQFTADWQRRIYRKIGHHLM